MIAYGRQYMRIYIYLIYYTLATKTSKYKGLFRMDFIGTWIPCMHEVCIPRKITSVWGTVKRNKRKRRTTK